MAKTGKSPQSRARLGLAGLAVIILLVLAVSPLLHQQPHAGGPGLAEEPLAMLGLAPASTRQTAASH